MDQKDYALKYDHLGPILPVFDASTTVDEAWELSEARTFIDHTLRDGDLVELKASTRGEFTDGCYVVPRGTLGSVAQCKVPKANILSGETAKYCAIVDVIVEGFTGKVHVPHIALRLMTQAAPRPDYISRNG